MQKSAFYVYVTMPLALNIRRFSKICEYQHKTLFLQFRITYKTHITHEISTYRLR